MLRSDVRPCANVTVVAIVQDNPCRGGRVTLRSRLTFRDYARTETLHINANHITPVETLKVGDAVKAGQRIGQVQPGGKLEIGPRPHVHLSVGPTSSTRLIHTDPNRFWQKGPGIVTCFNPDDPPGDRQLVAPIRC